MFKDALSDPRKFRELIAGILKLGSPEILYTGYNCLHALHNDELAEYKDSAIVKICVPGKELVRRSALRTIKLVIDELQKPKNYISLTGETVSSKKEIVAVSVTVESAKADSRSVRIHGARNP